MPEYAITVEDVYKSFGDVNALDGMSLAAEDGKILGLLGPNGAGKTTLVRILTTLLKADSGHLSIEGIDVQKHPEQVRRLIGLAGQYPAVDEQLTGRENLVMIGQLYHFSGKHARQRAKELLKRFTLEDAANRPVKTYSGGMRRRLDLAASIVARPDVLLLDEPTTGLDPRTRKDLWSVIRELVSDGTTLMLTTQYLEEADVLADYIVMINHGKTVAEGTSAQLKSHYANDVLEVRLESNGNDMNQALDILRGFSYQEPHRDNSGALIVPIQNGSQDMMAAVRALDSAGIAINDLSLHRPSLDDVFLTLTDSTGDTETEQDAETT